MVVYEKFWCRSLDRNWDWIFKTTLMDNHFKTICRPVRTECSSAWWNRLYPKVSADPGYPGINRRVNPKGGGGGCANLLFDQIILKTGWIWRKFYNEFTFIFFEIQKNSNPSILRQPVNLPHNSFLKLSYENHFRETRQEMFVYDSAWWDL